MDDGKNEYSDLTISSGGVSEHVSAEQLNDESVEAVTKAQLREAARNLNAQVPAGTQLKNPRPLERFLASTIEKPIKPKP